MTSVSAQSLSPVLTQSSAPISTQQLASEANNRDKFTADAIIKHFKENMFTSWYSDANMPPAFVKIFELINSNKPEDVVTAEVTEVVKDLIQYNEYLFHPDIQSALYQKDQNFLKNSMQSLHILGEIIAHYYVIKIDPQNINPYKLTKRTHTIEHLKCCFEQAKKLNDVKNGITSGIDYKKFDLANKNSSSLKDVENLFSIHTPGGLSQGGIELKSTLHRILSREFAGVIAYSAGSAGAEFAFKDDLLKTSALLAGTQSVMMIGFMYMMTSDSGMGYKVELQKSLLAGIYRSIYTTNPDSLKELSPATRKELKELLPNYVDFTYLGFKKEYSFSSWDICDNWSGENIQFTSADAADFFKPFLEKNKIISYEEIQDKLKRNFTLTNENDKKNLEICLHFLEDNVTKRNGVWGTLLDHLFSKFNSADQDALIAELKNGEKLFDCNYLRPNAINTLLNRNLSHSEEASSLNTIAPAQAEPLSLNTDTNLCIATAYVYNVLKNTPWEDRLVGARVFSKLMLDIYSCGLDVDKQASLVQIIGESLSPDSKFYSEFAKGNKKRTSKPRALAISFLYALTPVVSLALATPFVSFFIVPGSLIALIFTNILTSGAAASAFGFMAYGNYLGKSDSYKSKVKYIENAQKKLSVVEKDKKIQEALKSSELYKAVEDNQHDGIISKIEASSFRISYYSFMKSCQNLNALKNKRVNDIRADEWENNVNIIIEFVKFFKEKGVADFVLESNHGTRSCPLFDIITNIFDKKTLKKILAVHNLQEGVAPLNEEDLNQQALTHVNEILLELYGDKVEAKVKNLITHLKEEGGIQTDSLYGLNEDSFKIFLSEGFSSLAGKSDNELLIFSFEVFVLLAQMKNKLDVMNTELLGLKTARDRPSQILYQKKKMAYKNKLGIYKNFESILFQAVNDAAVDRASSLYNLQRNNPETYAGKKVLGRVFAYTVTVGGFKMMTGLAKVSISSSPILICASIVLCALDFAGRKYAESFEFSKRGRFSSKAHPNYEILCSMVDAHQEAIVRTGGLINTKRTSAREVLEGISTVRLNSTRTLNDVKNNEKIMIEALEECSDLYKRIDQEKIDYINSFRLPDKYREVKEKIQILSQEISKLYRQGFDKNSVDIIFIRIQRMVLSCDIPINEKRIILAKAADTGRLFGQLADILKTKNTSGHMQYGLVDFALGFLLASGAIALSMPATHDFFYPTLPGSTKLDSFNSKIREIILNTTLFTGAVGFWVHQADVSPSGRTKGFQIAMASFKHLLSLYPPAMVEEEKNDLLTKVETNFFLTADDKKILREEIENKYQEGDTYTETILKIHRKKRSNFIPWDSHPKSYLEYLALKNKLTSVSQNTTGSNTSLINSTEVREDRVPDVFNRQGVMV